MGTLLAALALALALATTALATDIVPTVVGANQLDAVAGPVVLQVFASNIIEDSTSPAPSIPDPFGNNRGDCQGSILSAAYQINATTWLYLYRLFCNCGPDWDVGYPEVDGFRIPLGTASVVSQDYDGNGSLEQLIRGDGNFAFGPGLSPFQSLGGGGTIDQIISGHITSSHVKFYNANGVFGGTDAFGFAANAPPILVTGQHLGGSNTSFSIVAPGQAQPQFGFAMSRTPAVEHVLRGHSAQYTVTVNPVPNTTAPQVTLSISGLPSATTATFSVNNATPPFTSILTIATTGGSVSQGGSPTGDFNLTLQGEGGGITQTLPVGLGIYDYSVGASPDTQEVCLNSSTSYTTTVTDIADPQLGHTPSITLSVSGLPAGASGTFSPNPVLPTANSTLTVQTGTPASGTYPLTITGTDPHGHTRTDSVSLEVDLRHEVARLIVWPVRTRPVVPLTVSYEVRQQGNALSNALGQRTHSHPTGT